MMDDSILFCFEEVSLITSIVGCIASYVAVSIIATS